MNETNIQSWECGIEDESEVNATLEGTTLTIRGNGIMMNYDRYNAPWCNENITKVIIEQGVTSIGNYAFLKCYGLKSVSIPNSVAMIGSGAFKECIVLANIIIPENVTSIENSTFEECKSLTKIIIPNGVTSIGYSAFYKCTNLKSFVLGKGVKYIRDSSLRSDGLKEIINPRLTPQSIQNEIHVYGKEKPQWISPFYNNVFEKITLYVPAESVNAYKLAPVWKDFKIILAIPEEDIITEETDEKIFDLKERIEIRKQEIKGFEQDIEKLEFKKVLLRGTIGNPKDVAQFMALFNQRDGLKYLTHDFDESSEFDRTKFLEQVRNVCTENFNQLNIPTTLKDLINQFVFEKTPKWTAFDNQFNPKEITLGWSASEWEKSNESKLHPIKYPEFAEIIKDFRRTIRIESPNLDVLISKVFADETFEIEKKDLSKADFYTHVGEFKSALETIFEEIKKRSDTPEKKKVSIEYKKRYCNEYAVREIVISHHNSFTTRDDEEGLIKEWLSLDKGSMGKIARHLQGYCHWSVVTKINDKPIRVNILREQDTPTQEEVDASDANGFTHILTFYYQS